MADKFLPCPHCGCDPRVSEPQWRDYIAIYVECCSSMEIRIGWSKAKDMSDAEISRKLSEKAITSWNQREQQDSDEITTLRAKLAESERDAARYRFIRTNKDAAVQLYINDGEDYCWCTYGETELDAAIDAAMPSTSNDKEVG